MASSYYVLFSVLLLPLLLLLKFKSSASNSKSKSKYRLPPGPWRLPIIGSIHHLVGHGLPHHVFCTLSRRYGHLLYLQLGEVPTVVVSSKEAAIEIMKTHDQKFCTRPSNPAADIVLYGARDIAFAPYGEYWREVRKISVSEILSVKRVQSFRSIREENIKNLMQQIRTLSSAGQSVDVAEKMSKLANAVTLEAMMGRKTKEQNLLVREIQISIELLTGLDVATLYPSSRLARKLSTVLPRARELHRNIDRLFDGIIIEQREKRKRKEEDGDAEPLLSVLLRLHDEGSGSENSKLSMDSVKGIIIDIIGAGTETSATTVVWAMAELMRNPQVMKKVQSELRQHLNLRLQGHDDDDDDVNITNSDLNQLHYLHLVLKETFRLHPPGPLLLQRECRETCNILGYDIPKGTVVLVNAFALGRDSNYWKDAEVFRPERFEEENSHVSFTGTDFELIPFGAGRRICPGINFALALVELILANLLYHFDWELPYGMKSGDEIDMTEKMGLAVGMNYPLLLRPIPHHFS